MKMGGNVFLASVGLITIAACSSGSNSLKADAGTTTGSCANPPKAEDPGLKACTGCTSSGTCTSEAPLDACCTWAGQPNAPLARGSNLHRYSGSGAVDLSCLASPPAMGTSKTATLSGYVKETNPNTDGAIDAMPLGTYTTAMTDPAYPQDTTWSSKCPSGCQFRQYTIHNVPTETALVIKTSDATGTGKWATVYDYNIFFSNSSLMTPDGGGAAEATYLATAAEATDLGVVTGTVGISPQAADGMLAGEVHDCGDVRLSGATVGVTVPPQGRLFYFTSDEGNPIPDQQAHVTSELGLFGGVNFPAGKPVRVTAMGEDPASAGKFLLVGTYVVQVYPGAVTALALRGRRPWQL